MCRIAPTHLSGAKRAEQRDDIDSVEVDDALIARR